MDIDLGEMVTPTGERVSVRMTGPFRNTGLMRLDTHDVSTGERILQFGKNVYPEQLTPLVHTSQHDVYLALVKDYSECTGYLAALLDAGFARDTGIVVHSGHIEMHMVEIRPQSHTHEEV